jgi:hypothetical protein
MNPADPNLPLLESVAHALGPLCDRFVFVGGCATGLLVTDRAASPVRATQDVDVVVEVVSLAGYHTLERPKVHSVRSAGGGVSDEADRAAGHADGEPEAQ